VLAHDSAQADWYRLAGHCWDALQRPDSAQVYYKRGLLRFPKSGALHWELGRQFALAEDEETALGLWNLGILAEPSFPNNYFQAARAYSRTTTPVWALLYAELYLNLAAVTPPDANRAEASRLLYFLHQQTIRFPTDSTALVKLTDQNQIYLADDDSTLVIPFPLALQMGYHAAVGQVLLPRQGALRTAPLTLQELADLRLYVVNNWATQGRDTSTANVLYRWHQDLIAQGHWEAYHIWLMQAANTETLHQGQEWRTLHAADWQAFVQWRAQHPLQMPIRTLLCAMLFEQ
jgi:tetratricopeptide (TPR) repeat protein